MSLETTIIYLGMGTGILIAVIYIAAICVGKKSIFGGSGRPVSMAQTLLSSIQVIQQNLFGILALIILSLLIINEIITSDAGLPIISGIIGYLLGKTYKDISFQVEERKAEKPQSVPGTTSTTSTSSSTSTTRPPPREP